MTRKRGPDPAPDADIIEGLGFYLRDRQVVVVCVACGEAGHQAEKFSGVGPRRCSPSFLAARLVMDHGVEQHVAARRFGVTQQNLWNTLHRLGHRRGPRRSKRAVARLGKRSVEEHW